MSPEQQRIAIAEWWGWFRYPSNDPTSLKWRRQFDNSTLELHEINLPNYPADLNAIHEAIGKLSDTQKIELAGHLYEVARSNHFDKDVAMVTATAGQIAYALLCTIGKWTDATHQKDEK